MHYSSYSKKTHQGGKRENSGRKKLGENKKTSRTISLSPNDWEKLEALKATLNLNSVNQALGFLMESVPKVEQTPLLELKVETEARHWRLKRPDALRSVVRSVIRSFRPRKPSL